MRMARWIFRFKVEGLSPRPGKPAISREESRQLSVIQGYWNSEMCSHREKGEGFCFNALAIQCNYRQILGRNKSCCLSAEARISTRLDGFFKTRMSADGARDF